MKTKWTVEGVSHQFDAYDDYIEDLLAYRPLIADLIDTCGTKCSVLDYGCGGGKVSRRLKDNGIAVVTGVDISATMVAKATNHPDRGGTHYKHISSGMLPFGDSSFDAAICCYVLINVHERQELIRIVKEIGRVLKPGAPLYINDTNPDSTGIQFSTFRSGDAGVAYTNGTARPVYLDLPDGRVFDIIDTHWEKRTYHNVLEEAGFSNIKMVERRAGDVPEADRARLGDAEHASPPFLMIKAIWSPQD